MTRRPGKKSFDLSAGCFPVSLSDFQRRQQILIFTPLAVAS